LNPTNQEAFQGRRECKITGNIPYMLFNHYDLYDINSNDFANAFKEVCKFYYSLWHLNIPLFPSYYGGQKWDWDDKILFHQLIQEQTKSMLEEHYKDWGE